MATGTTKNDTIHFDPAEASNDGLGGTDTLLFDNATGTDANLSTITLTSIEILKAGLSTATTFTVDPADVAAVTTVQGSTGTDTLVNTGTAFDLSTISLSSVEILKAGNSTAATTFTLQQADLAKNGQVIGNAGHLATITAVGSTLDLTSTTTSNIETLSTTYAKGTTFTLDGKAFTDELASIQGAAGNDSLVVKDSTIDLSDIALSSIESVKAGTTSNTTITLAGGTLKADGGSVTSIAGSTGSDTLIVADTEFDLSQTTLSSIETLKSGTAGTTFTLDQADLAKGGSVIGSTGNDTIDVFGSSLDLTSTTLTSVEKLIKSVGDATFTVDDKDFGTLNTISAAGADSLLIVKSTSIDVSAKTIDGISLKAGLAGATTFTVLDSQLGPDTLNGVIGSSGSDKLVVDGTDFDLSNFTLSSVEQLVAGSTADTTFTLDQADLAKSGSVIGSTGTDTILAAGSSLDLSSTTLTSIEAIKADAGGTLFTLAGDQFATLGAINGAGGTDILVVKGTNIDVSGGTISSIEELRAGVATATTFKVNLNQINGGAGDVNKISGSTGSDTLIVAGSTNFDLSSVTLSSVEKLVAGTTSDTTFTLDAGDVAAGGSIVGNGTSATDTIVAAGSSLDLSKTTLTGIDELTTKHAAGTEGTVFTLTAAQLAGLDIAGSTGVDTVKITTAIIDFSSTTLTSIEGVGAGLASATTITLKADQLDANGGPIANIEGNTGVDTLKILGTDFDLSGTTVTSIEKLVASANGTSSTVFTLDNADLAATGGGITGSSNAQDEIVAVGTSLDLSKTTISGVEKLSAAAGTDTTFTLTAAQVKALKIDGTGGDDDTLILNTSAFDISSANLTSIEMLKAGVATATTFTVNSGQLGNSGGLIEAISGGTSTLTSDTLIVKGTAFDLSSTAVTNVEIFKAGSAAATTFTVDQADLDGMNIAGQVVGSSGSDTLLTHGTKLDLSSVTLSSVELIKGDNVGGTTFTLNQKDLAAGGTVEGDAVDTIVAADTQLDLSSTNLVSIEVLKAGTSLGTRFTVDTADLAVLTDVKGHAGGSDSLVVKGTTSVDLTSTSLSSVETLSGSLSTATTFTLDNANLNVLTGIIGSTGTDTLIVADTDFDLTSTALTSIEVLKAGADDTTFTLTQDDLKSGGSVIGSSAGKNDTIAAGGSSLDLTSTTLSNIENVTVSFSSGSTLTVTAAQLASLNVTGGSTTTNDTLVVAGTAFDLTSTTLTNFEALKAGSSLATTFTLDAADVTALGAAGSISGSTGTDTLTILGSAFDLSATSLSSVEILKSGATGTNSTTFTLDGADIAAGGTIVGSANGSDKIIVSSTAINLSSTTLSGIELLEAGSTNTTTFTLTQAQVNGLGITGSAKTDDSLVISGTSFDLTNASLTSIENLKGGANGTTFTVDQADLVSGGSVTGNAGSASIDTLIVKGTQADLSSTSITSVEVLKTTAGSTTFIVDANDLVSGGSVVGSSGTDTLQAAGVALDLTSTTLSSVEIIKAGTTGATTFTVDQTDITGRAVTGNSGNDTLKSVGTNGLDLTSTTLTSVEILDASAGGNVTVDQADLAGGGLVVGGAGSKLIINGTSLNLASTTLNGIEILEAKSTLATTFTVNQADLAVATTIHGSSSSGDALVTADTQLDVTGLTLTGIEKIGAGTDNDTTITVNQTAVNALGTAGLISGGAGLDTLTTSQASLDLSSTSVDHIEILSGSNAGGTTFTVDQADLSFGGTVSGGGTTDILLAAGSSLNLQNIILVGIEEIGTAYSKGTTFTVDAADLAVAETVSGHTSANDTLILKGTAFDLTSTVLSSVEILQATGAAAVTFTVDTADLATGGSVIGITGQDDILTITGTTDFDLSHTTLSSVEHLLADTADSTFKVDQGDLASGGTVEGLAGGTDVISAAGTSLDLTSTTLVDIEQLKAGTTSGTTFTLDSPSAFGAITGNSGTDTLVVNSTDFDLTSTTTTGVEVLKAGSSSATTFTVDAADLASGGSVIGGSGNDKLLVNSNTIDLSSTTLTSVEHVSAVDPSVATTYTIGGGLGSTSIDLGNANAASDIINVTAGYKVSDLNAISDHIVSVTNFETGAGADTIDVSALVSGTAVYQDIQSVIDFFAPATLQDALNLAATKNGATNTSVASFEWTDGNTYIVVDKSAGSTLTADDAVIKLVGVTGTLHTDNIDITP